MIVTDTSVWIDYFKGIDSPQHRALRRLIENDEDVSITDIILTEILQGIREDHNFQKVRESLREFPLQKPQGTETYVYAAQIYRDCRKKGKTPRKTVDCIIAAICLENDLPILHKDSDFDTIEECAGLKVVKA